MKHLFFYSWKHILILLHHSNNCSVATRAIAFGIEYVQNSIFLNQQRDNIIFISIVNFSFLFLSFLFLLFFDIFLALTRLLYRAYKARNLTLLSALWLTFLNSFCNWESSYNKMSTLAASSISNRRYFLSKLLMNSLTFLKAPSEGRTALTPFFKVWWELSALCVLVHPKWLSLHVIYPAYFSLHEIHSFSKYS